MDVSSREPWRPSDGDSKCQQCYGPNPVWWCNDGTWNMVMGGFADREAGGILCPTCFMLKAQDSSPGPRVPQWEVARRWPVV